MGRALTFEFLQAGSLADNPQVLPARPLHPRKRTSRHQQLTSAMGHRGACARFFPPKKSGLSVKNVTLIYVNVVSPDAPPIDRAASKPKKHRGYRGLDKFIGAIRRD